MAQPHTYGPTCYLAPSVTFPAPKDDDTPALKAQFFYSSPLPIDDPLAAIPPVSGDSKSTKYLPLPFSAYDNNALEEAWLGLGSDQDRKHHQKLKNPPLKALSRREVRRASVAAKNKKNADEFAAHGNGGSPARSDHDACPDSRGKRGESGLAKHATDGAASIPTEEAHQVSEDNSPPELADCCPEPGTDSLIENGKAAEGDVSNVAKSDAVGPAQEDGADESTLKQSESHDFANRPIVVGHKGTFEVKAIPVTQSAAIFLTIPGTSDIGTTGKPFLRAESRGESSNPRPSSPASKAPSSVTSIHDDMGQEDPMEPTSEHGLGASGKVESETLESVHVHQCKAHKKARDQAEVPVGVSRLHLVKLPALTMMPIYWSPIHDIAAVIRGTWFYKVNMCPIEPPVANQLEIGYRDLRPWSQTWTDELDSAIEVGAAGEEKIAHQLWPKDSDGSEEAKPKYSTIDPYCAAKCFHGEVAASGSVEVDEKTATTAKATGTAGYIRRFPNSQVIYKDAHNAYILKPSLQPSAYYGRKPLVKIRKNTTVGIHVVRGFDYKGWDKLHPSSSKRATISKNTASKSTPVAGDADVDLRNECPACRDDRPKVTDLVLVIHGIGQKLSERVESFHFTHAINAFRRSVNVELANESVRSVLRKDLGGIMVLPLNWRANLSFDDAVPTKAGDESVTEPEFTLKDITPNTIPAVRNLITDVMLDIPFYMSHHKPKMIESLVAESNRVYRLWCRNNPDFQKEGRVHLIAHSLGSAMAMDVLSKQPTSLHPIDVHSRRISAKQFDFDTKCLFLAGSPSGFFLLLEKGSLIPRKGRNKPGTDPSDESKEVVGNIGRFGCLAVDNLYNVMQANDPIAYRLNATVDPLYASVLKDAFVPSTTTGFFEAVSNKMRSITSGAPSPAEIGVGQLVKPAPIRQPSALEMAVHDFSREEIAEKKFYLLNDNGQVDYFLLSGGGLLDLQYVNMLGAHSSYWTSPEFVRMLVMEVGRRPGKNFTMPNMRVLKKTPK